MRKVFVVMMIGAAVSLIGCGKNESKNSGSEAGNVSVSGSGDHMTITGSHGEKVEFGSGSSATSKLPSYLSLYPGATVTASFTGSGQDGSGGLISFHVKASPAEVIAFYKQKAAAGGMADTMNAEMGGTSTYVAADEKTKKQMSVSATKAADGSDVQLTWGTK